MFQPRLSYEMHHTDLLEIKLSKNSIGNVRIRREVNEKFFPVRFLLGEPKINSFYNSVLFLMKILWSFAFVPLL
jgi:hypothetical protein